MQWKYAALAALVAGGAYVGVDALRGDTRTIETTSDTAGAATAPETVVPTAAPGLAAETTGAPTEMEVRLAAAEAERDQLRTALDAASAERDALSADFAAREAEAAVAPDEIAATDDPADAAGAASEIERLLADLAAQAAEIDRLKVEIAARDVELDALRASTTLTAEPELLTPTLVSATGAPLVAAPSPDSAATFAARLEAVKSGLPLPRPHAEMAVAQGEPPLALVLFERGSARLSTGAAERTGAAAATLAALGPALVRVTGHSDTTGSPNANMRLSHARAEAVAAALVAAGLPAERIEVSALGQEFDALPVLTGDGVAEPLNRSVGIYALASAE